MAFDFPSAPTVGDIHTEAGVEYQYEGNSVWNLAGGGGMTDYVLKAGDTMVGPLTVQASPTNGGVALRLPNGAEPGHIAWLNGDGTRKAYMGAGAGTALTLNLDAATSLNLVGGNLFMEGAGGIHWSNNTVASGVNDFSKGICLYGYGTTSQFGFCITSGTLNISVQAAANKVDFNVAGTTQFRVSSGTSNMYSNFHCAGTITSGVANGGNALSLNDGARINFSSGCLISKVHGSNQFQHHTNGGQVFTFHISGFGDAFVIDTVGSTGNSYSATAPEALALGAELGVARRKPETESTLEGVDIVKMLAALLLKVKTMEAEIASLKARK
jgi:hypothetical protein